MKLYSLCAYDIMYPAGDPTIFVPAGVQVGLTLFFNLVYPIYITAFPRRTR
jgi:hypothetical protein